MSCCLLRRTVSSIKNARYKSRTLSHFKTLKGRIFPLNLTVQQKFWNIKYGWILFSSNLLFKLLSNMTQAFSFEKFSTCLVVNKVTSGQRGVWVFQAGEVFLNGLEPNISDCFRLPLSFFEICLKCRLATVFLNVLAHSEPKWPCLFVNSSRMPTSICVSLWRVLRLQLPL